MPLPQEIQNALQVYDHDKGFWRRLFRRDQAAIRALRTLSDVDQTNFLKIYQCFIENLPKPTQASYQVYQALLTYLNNTDFCDIPGIIDKLHFAKLIKHINLDVLNNLDARQFKSLASILKKLNNATLLTHQNLANITPYFEAPEMLNIIETMLNIYVDRLNQENLSDLFNLLKELYPKIQLNQVNADQLALLRPNDIRMLTHLLKRLSVSQLLTQNNFANILKLHETIGIIGIIVSAVDHLDTDHCLTQENLNSLLETPMYAANMATALVVLNSTSLLNEDNRSKLNDPANQFLLSNKAYSLLWRPLLPYLLKLADINERQSIFDPLINFSQQENPVEKIENYMRELNSEFDTPRPRAYSENKFFTAPPAQNQKPRSSLENLVDLSRLDKSGTL